MIFQCELFLLVYYFLSFLPSISISLYIIKCEKITGKNTTQNGWFLPDLVPSSSLFYFIPIYRFLHHEAWRENSCLLYAYYKLLATNRTIRGIRLNVVSVLFSSVVIIACSDDCEVVLLLTVVSSNSPCMCVPLSLPSSSPYVIEVFKLIFDREERHSIMTSWVPCEESSGRKGKEEEEIAETVDEAQNIYVAE